ncbi:MAG: DUF1080 domain-containing protein [Planctomycetes bacterium]|nr:DUF1080 domain-containing protein [Planctomycetota bacterium]
MKSTALTFWITLCMLAGALPGFADEQRDDAAAFAIQGEYVGPKMGMQVVALGHDRFEAYLLPGGLPGEGWNRRTRDRFDGARVDGVTHLINFDGAAATITDGSGVELLKPDGKPWAKLEKVHRKSPTEGAAAPPGAIVLFDGTNLDAWRTGATMTTEHELAAPAVSKQAFGDMTMHVEYRTPFEPDKRDMARGNSGVILDGRYELQINDSFGRWPTRLRNAAIFELRDPDLDATFPPGGWQTYDIDFAIVRVDADGKIVKHATITVRHNGVLVHDQYEIPHPTNAAFTSLRKKPEGDAQPFELQYHGSPVIFRNVWVVAHDKPEAP